MGDINKQVINSPRKRPPARTPEAKENEMISLAIDLAEKQLRAGTASSQTISHFLKLATTTAKLEKEILEEQKKLLVAKTRAIESSERTEELYKNAMEAMRRYSGYETRTEDD